MVRGSAGTHLAPELVDFLSERLAIVPSRIGPETRLFEDLGVDGADALELFDAFAHRFGVDLSGFEPARHFGPEAGWNRSHGSCGP